MKLQIGGEKTFPGPVPYSSYRANCHFEVDLDPALMGADPTAVRNKMRALWLEAFRGIDEEIERQRTTMQPIIEPRRAEPPTSRPDYQNGDEEIEQARQRTEPAAVSGNGHTKQTFNWNRGSGLPNGGQYGGNKAGRQGGGNGGGYGPPQTGKQLWAWANRQEENGSKGFVKGLTKWCKDQGFPWKFEEFTQEEVAKVYQIAMDSLENAN